MTIKKKVNQTPEHNCLDHRVYLKGCKECEKCEDDPRKCDLVVYGICSVCGEIVKPEIKNLEVKKK